jgi:SagB-type dehydrogenase family enzyme
MSDQLGLSRRDALKMAALAGGGLAVSGLLAACGSAPVSAGVAVTETLPAEPTQPEPTQVPSESPLPLASPTGTPPEPEKEATLPPAGSLGGTLALPAPRLEDSAPLGQALQQRRSTRSFRPDELSLQILSDLLWAAFGVNRPDGKRTAPSAYNVQDIELYPVTAKGVFHYDASLHALTALLPDDLRSRTGSQAFVGQAPLNLVLASNYERMASFSQEERQQWSWAHSGCIAQNVYLFCATAGLGTVVRSTLDRARLASDLGLSSSQHITLVQTVGFPQEAG